MYNLVKLFTLATLGWASDNVVVSRFTVVVVSFKWSRKYIDMAENEYLLAKVLHYMRRFSTTYKNSDKHVITTQLLIIFEQISFRGNIYVS